MAGTDYSAFFCWNCGAKVQHGVKQCPQCGVKYTGKTKYGDRKALGAGGVGWSYQANNPFFHKYAKKYMLASVIWMIGLSILVPTILLVSGQVTPSGEGLRVLIIVPAICWLVGIIFLMRKFGGRNKSWDGVVENKTEEKKVRIENRKTEGYERIPYMEYTITFRRQDGSTKTIRDENNASNYLHFNFGEYVRCHQTKYLKYIEKYDKSHDDALFCAACGTLNDARDNYCGRCGAPMLKGNLEMAEGYTEANVAAAYQRESLFCSQCGSKLTDGPFCENFGAKVN